MRPLKSSGESLRRVPRPLRTTSMNCWWISPINAFACSTCRGSSGENGSRNALFSPEVSTRRSTPSFCIVSTNPKLSISTPIDPTRLALST